MKHKKNSRTYAAPEVESNAHKHTKEPNHCVPVTYRQECPRHERRVNCKSKEQDAMAWGVSWVQGKPWIYLEPAGDPWRLSWTKARYS